MEVLYDCRLDNLDDKTIKSINVTLEKLNATICHHKAINIYKTHTVKATVYKRP